MDYHNRLLTNLKQKDKIKGVKIGEAFNLIPILFVDDILLFVEDRENISNLIDVLHVFEDTPIKDSLSS